MNYEPIEPTMKKLPIQSDVYTEAKKRINNIIDITDDRIVMFSGGKDSLATLYLTKEVYDERNLGKVKVAFLDEEFIPDVVIDFVQSIYESNVFDFRYYGIQLKSRFYSVSSNHNYIQWDKNRENVRELPDYAITTDNVLDQYSTNNFICKDMKGKIAMIRGIRADESGYRMRGVILSKGKPYISKTENKRIINTRPIYDWSQRDVFLYFYKNNIEYCHEYERQHYLKGNKKYRISSVIGEENKDGVWNCKYSNPEIYDRVTSIFPEMIAHERYYHDTKKETYMKYPHTVSGLFQFIEDKVKDKNDKKLCYKHMKKALAMRKKDKDNGYKVGKIPLRELFIRVERGGYKRPFIGKKPYLKDYLFEGYTEKEYYEDKEKGFGI